MLPGWLACVAELPTADRTESTKDNWFEESLFIPAELGVGVLLWPHVAATTAIYNVQSVMHACSFYGDIQTGASPNMLTLHNKNLIIYQPW